MQLIPPNELPSAEFLATLGVMAGLIQPGKMPKVVVSNSFSVTVVSWSDPYLVETVQLKRYVNNDYGISFAGAALIGQTGSILIVNLNGLRVPWRGQVTYG